ncbi:hypothetical protein B0H13DRAFT_2303284 [Mycena leptocephala]|nr:hypothetical protein B0H13DRAFT_2303284 [Mycena leptocephala]
MAVENFWRNLKHETLHHLLHPRLDQLIYLIATDVLPAFEAKMQIFESDHRAGRVKSLTPWQKAFKKEWKKLAARKLGTCTYNTCVADWTCSCGQQKYNAYLLCKHLVHAVCTPDPAFFREVNRRRVIPFYRHPLLKPKDGPELDQMDDPGSITDGDRRGKVSGEPSRGLKRKRASPPKNSAENPFLISSSPSPICEDEESEETPSDPVKDNTASSTFCDGLGRRLRAILVRSLSLPFFIYLPHFFILSTVVLSLPNPLLSLSVHVLTSSLGILLRSPLCILSSKKGTFCIAHPPSALSIRTPHATRLEPTHPLHTVTDVLCTYEIVPNALYCSRLSAQHATLALLPVDAALTLFHPSHARRAPSPPSPICAVRLSSAKVRPHMLNTAKSILVSLSSPMLPPSPPTLPDSTMHQDVAAAHHVLHQEIPCASGSEARITCTAIYAKVPGRLSHVRTLSA